jgi:hypothetical protein
MSSSENIILCKQKIGSALVNSDEIIEMLNESCVGRGDELLYENIFPFQKAPDTEEEKKTYICYTVDTNISSSRSRVFENITIAIYVVTHQDLMRCKYNGTRIDFVGSMVIDLLNDKNFFGLGDFEKVSDTEGSADFLHRYREIVFTTKGLNTDMCGD